MESSASISNSAGDLLFYTNGKNVWNNSNYIMPNGSNLDIDQLFTFGSSVTQGVIIIPKPYDDNMYYIFTISNTGFNNSKPGLSYHLIDLTQDFGNGDIVSKNNIAITDTIAINKYTATEPHNRSVIFKFSE